MEMGVPSSCFLFILQSTEYKYYFLQLSIFKEIICYLWCRSYGLLLPTQRERTAHGTVRSGGDPAITLYGSPFLSPFSHWLEAHSPELTAMPQPVV